MGSGEEQRRAHCGKRQDRHFVPSSWFMSFRFKERKNWYGGREICVIINQPSAKCGLADHY
jgi:hypothetical protein